MNRRDAAIRATLILLLSAGLAGCQDRSIGTINADRRVFEELERTTSDRPAKPATKPSGRSTTRPDLNDRSPKLRGKAAKSLEKDNGPRTRRAAAGRDLSPKLRRTETQP
jgi:hypothetical protein